VLESFLDMVMPLVWLAAGRCAASRCAVTVVLVGGDLAVASAVVA